jgi:hypothetical protein
MRIEKVTAEFDGRDSQRHAEVTIEVKPYGLAAKTFRHVDARDVKNWALAEYPVETPPFDIRKQFEKWQRQIERQEARQSKKRR